MGVHNEMQDTYAAVVACYIELTSLVYVMSASVVWLSAVNIHIRFDFSPNLLVEPLNTNTQQLFWCLVYFLQYAIWKIAAVAASTDTTIFIQS